MLNRDTEAQRFDIVQICGIAIKTSQNVIGTLFCDGAIDGINIAQFALIVSAAHPVQLAQIDSIRYTKILERTEQFAVDGFRKADIGSDTYRQNNRECFYRPYVPA